MKEKSVFLVKLCLFFMIVFFFPMTAEVSANSSSLANFEYTEKNVMNLLNKVDSDGAYIVQYGINRGDDIMNWYSEWGFSHAFAVLDSIGTAVHEECHSYMFYHHYSGSWTEGYDYYIGNKKCISVNQTNVYKTEKMAAGIPSSLQTFRYSTYVAKGVSASSNVDGIYGLLNEFTAYYWGAHAENLISEEYGTWNYESNIVRPYYEFLYWMERYMIYAKAHYPKVYSGILNNKQFIKAFSTIEENYRKEVVYYINKRDATLGSETKSLQTELSKDEYTNMLSILRGGSAKANTDNSSSSNTESGKKTTTVSYVTDKSKQTATLKSYSDKSTTAFQIPSYVMIGGKKYKVTAIAKNAFKGNKTLKTVKIPDTVTSIGTGAFQNCTSLQKVTIGNKVKTIGGTAFANCTSLKEINVPASVVKIGSKAFYNDKKLTSLTISSKKLTSKTIGTKAFTGAGKANYKKLVVKVPAGKYSSYKKILRAKGLSKKVTIKKQSNPQSG